MPEHPLSQPPPEFSPEPILTQRRKLLIAGFTMALALGYVMYIAFQNAAVFYLTIDELLSKGDDMYEETVRVSGQLIQESYREPLPGSIETHFSLTNGNQTLPAVYSGPLNDLFFNEHLLNFGAQNASDPANKGGFFN